MTTQKIDQALARPCTSYWLKDALRSAMKRDCVDAVHDAEQLAQLLNERLNAIQGGRL